MIIKYYLKGYFYKINIKIPAFIKVNNKPKGKQVDCYSKIIEALNGRISSLDSVN